MGLVDSLRKTLHNARSVAFGLDREFRAFTVAVCREYIEGSSSSGPVLDFFSEANGAPPRVTWTKDEDVAFGNAPADLIEIGPITPIGRNAELLDELDECVSNGETRHVLITGPGMTEGRKYRILSIDKSRPLRRMIRAQSEGQGLQGFG
jgi:hypothetical protein